MAETKKLFLLDAMALIYRAYYALNRNPRINSKGLNTSAVLGFANTLTELLRNEQPSHIAVAFDSAGPTLRVDDFSAYKANREDMPEDIVSSLPYIFKLLEGFRIPALILPGYEADDIVGTVAKKAAEKDFMVYMMTSDKDFGQLVSDRIFMYRPSRSGDSAEVLGVKEVCERYGIERPEQLIDILGLWGDSSDNIPGVPGIGEVKAKKLIRQFGSIEHLLDNLDQVAEKRMRESLREHAAQARMSKHLATIMLDVPIEWDLQSMQRRDPDPEILVPLFDELEFRTFARRLFSDQRLMSQEGTLRAQALSAAEPAAKETEEPEASPAKSRETHGQISLFEDGDAVADPTAWAAERLAQLQKQESYRLLEKDSDIDLLISDIRRKACFCFDTETTGLVLHDAHLVGIAFSLEKGAAFYVPFPEDEKQARALAERFSGVFADEKIIKIGQNLKFDIAVLARYDIQVRGTLFDTMLAHYLLQPDMRHNMDLLAETYLGYRPVSIEHLIGKKGPRQKSLRELPLATVAAYACEDADITLQLHDVFAPMLREQGLEKLFAEAETPLVPVLASMEREGVRIDREALDVFSKELQSRMEDTEKQIYELAGERFNIGSPRQLGEVLFDRMKIVTGAKRTRTRQYSTSEDVLSKLESKHPVIGKILEFRSLSKLRSTYVDALPKLIHPATGRIHTSYNQAVAATGRLSSNNPNLQNIPIRTEDGRLIRRAFVPRDADHLLLAADYSQIELRIIASLSGDKAMQEAFIHGLDIHAATAARVFDVPLDEVDRDMRRKAKTVNFGIVYGISAFGLSERLGIARKEAAELIEQYFATYPGIRDYMNRQIEHARLKGYVETLLGRRRYISDINSSNGVVRGYAERNAINAPVQGSAADMIKLAMIRIFDAMQKEGLRSRMILQVHDELVFDARRDELETLRELVVGGMKNAMELSVPVVVDAATGENWLEAH